MGDDLAAALARAGFGVGEDGEIRRRLANDPPGCASGPPLAEASATMRLLEQVIADLRAASEGSAR